MIQNKNTTLNLFKLLAAYMVVFIHVRFYGQAALVVDALARFAVPFFFLVSGYFSYNITTDKIKKRMVYICKLIVFSELAYFIWYICKFLIQRNLPGFTYFITELIKPENIKLLLIFNEHPLDYAHLWYLFAILYVYILFYFAIALKIPEKVLFTISLLLMAGTFMLNEGIALQNIKLERFYIRNFLFMGIPFFGLGLMVKKHKDRLTKIPDVVAAGFTLVGVSLTLLSLFYIGSCEIYIGSLFILTTAVIYSIKYEDMKYPSFITQLSDCSTFIYIFHIMVKLTLHYLFVALNISERTVFITNMLPIINCITTTALALVRNKFYNHIKANADKLIKV